jgi:hypothetical protein
LLKKHGFTKKNLGVTAHGLRHQYMQNLYKQLTGSDSPVREVSNRPLTFWHMHVR